MGHEMLPFETRPSPLFCHGSSAVPDWSHCKATWLATAQSCSKAVMVQPGESYQGTPSPLTNPGAGVDGLHHVHAMPVTRRDTLLAPQQSRLGREWVREMQAHLNPLIDPLESAPFWSAFIR